MTGTGPSRVRNIAELAALAGVNAGTVSRALAGNPLVKQETRERIQALAREHGYRPNQMARRLRIQETRVIGLVVPLGHEKRQHLSDPFFMSILGHLADALTENGYDIMLSRVIPDAEDWLERIVDSGMLDGVLLIGQSNQYDTIERVAAWYKPLVVWGSHRPGQIHCTVGVDNRQGGRLAGECLIAAGRKRLAFLGETVAPELQERYLGLCDAAAAAGLEAPLKLDTHLASDVMADEIAAHVEAIKARVDGIAAGSDLIAKAAVRLARATRNHPKIRRGASIRAALAIAELTAVFLRNGSEFRDAFIDAVLMALPTRIDIEREGASGRALVTELDARGIACSTGSACSTGKEASVERDQRAPGMCSASSRTASAARRRASAHSP